MQQPRKPEHVSARVVNEEAGTHVISADPAEQSAAEAATRRSWREFPYYARRYGERGWRFSLSDSGWISTLCDLPPVAAREQIRWLGGLLASRGMPLVLLERHLFHLHDEMLQAYPDRSARYAALQRSAAGLREARFAQIPEEKFALLAADFEAHVKNCPGRVVNMGTVLVGAVADELGGTAKAVETVMEWACDEAVFSPEWISAVQDVVAAGRRSSTGNSTSPGSPVR